MDYYNETEWVDLLADTKKFVYKDSGLSGLPTLTVMVNNRANKNADKWSLSALRKMTLKLDDHKLFRGWVETSKGAPKGYKADLLTLEGYYDFVRLLKDSKTAPYKTEQWNIYDALGNMWGDPDSGVQMIGNIYANTGLQTKMCPHDPKEEMLWETIKKFMESAVYDVWFFLDASWNPCLNCDPIGQNMASPAITLTEPYLKVEPVYSKEDVKNIIFVYGNIDLGLPPDGDLYFTEGHATGTWTAISEGTTVTEKATDKKKFGDYSVKVTMPLGGDAWIRCTVANCGFISQVDASEKDGVTRFVGHLEVWIKLGASVISITCRLEDSAGNRIFFTNEKDCPVSVPDWIKLIYNGLGGYIYPSGSGMEDAWQFESGYSSFNWLIKKIDLVIPTIAPQPSHWIDGLHFKGGLEIDPFKFPTHNPKIQDSGSISWLGYPSVYHFTAQREKINTFEEAQSIGNLLIQVLKNPLKTVSVTPPACVPQARAGLCGTFTLSGYGINSEIWRILEVEQTFDRAIGRIVRTKLNLTPRYSQIAFEKLSEQELAGILAAMKIM